MKNTRNNFTPLNLGFIGGSIDSAVGYTHFVASQMDNSWKLVSGCFSQDESINTQTANNYGVSKERLYIDWQEMLEKERGKLDVIVILLPTTEHIKAVKKSLEMGFAVICEKSLASNSSEAAKILELQKKNNSFLAVTYNYSGYPMVRELQKKIRNGELGKIIHFQVEMPQEGYIRVDSEGNKPRPQAWRLKDGTVPILHLDLAVHLHQLIYFLTEQNPTHVVSDQDSYGWFPEVIDNVNCMCRYTDGIMGSIWFSKSALGHRNGLKLRIYGTKGSAEWFQASPEELQICRSNGQKEIIDRAANVEVTNLKRYNRFKAGHPAGFIEAFANLYYDFSQSILDYRSNKTWEVDKMYGTRLSLKGLQFLEAMNRSVKSKTWEKLENFK